MKLFWTIIAIFALAAAGMVWAQSRAGQAGPTLAREGGVAVRPAPIDDSSTMQPLRSDVLADETREAERERETDATRLVDAGAGVEDDGGEGDAKAKKDEIAKQLIGDLLGEDDDDAPPMVATKAGSPDHEHVEPQRAENPWEGEQAAADRGPMEHSVEPQPDGSTLVDGTFTVKGEGTKDSPYEITWDYLMSAAETYQPRLGMNDLPERIKMLDGAHVKIAGFLMFPMASFEANEALVMLNMWDGCCIGTMPSPYDAIEVQFARGIPASTRQFANYGTVEGKLVVDPYLISDWLIGLYVLEDASLHVGM